MNAVLPMAAEVLDDGRVPHAGSRLFSRAVAASLVIHGGVFSVLLSATFMPVAVQEKTSASLQSISVTLVNTTAPAPINPADAQPGATATPNPSLEPEVSSPDVAETLALQETRSAERTEQAEREEREEENSAQAVINEQRDTDSTNTAQALTTEANDREAVMALVNASMASFRAANRNALNQEYVEACLRFRNRYGQNRDCPEQFGEAADSHSNEKALVGELFANMTRDADNARLGRKLARENELLEEIIAAGGPAGEQAEIRWRLNRQYHAYLNGNILPELTFRSQTAFVNDYNRTITPAPYQFVCRQWPCVYKYTGFTVKRPANYVEQEPSFSVRPPLFRTSQD